jgi:hypothetical protein
MLEQIHGPELVYFHAGSAHVVEEAARCVHASYAVVQHADRDAFVPLLR